MSYQRLVLGLAACASGLVLWAGALAQPVPLPPEGTNPARPATPRAPAAPANEVVQTFPSNEGMQTAWKVHWGARRGNGLYIEDAWFKRGPNDDWMQVLGDTRLAEAFVPYHSGTPRFWDVSYNFPLCVVSREDAGPYGKLLYAPDQHGRGKNKDNSPAVLKPYVVQEIRDRGIAWKSAAGVRRGRTLVLWGTLEAAN